MIDWQRWLVGPAFGLLPVEPGEEYRMRWYHWPFFPGVWLLAWAVEYCFCPIPHPDQSWLSLRYHAWESRRLERLR